jgi:hypothetical protein
MKLSHIYESKGVQLIVTVNYESGEVDNFQVEAFDGNKLIDVTPVYEKFFENELFEMVEGVDWREKYEEIMADNREYEMAYY